MSGDYSQVTEIPGVRLTREAIAMMHTRYAFAAQMAEGRDVVEVACGAGQGLGLLQKRARRVVAGDYTESLLRVASRHYAGRVRLVRLDGHALPFVDRSFDLAILYEAVYYLARPEQFVAECRRVLRQGGRLVVCTVNRLWRGFNPSPHSVAYPTAPELGQLLTRSGFDVQLFGAYREQAVSRRSQMVARARALAVALDLVPKTMRGKELLKRLFYGPLHEMPRELADLEGAVAIPQPLRDPDDPSFKVVYAVGTLG